MSLRKRLNEPIEIKAVITRREFLLLKKIAESNQLGPYEYARNILKNWIKAQLRGRYKSIYDSMTIEELAEFYGDLDDNGNIQYLTSAAKKLKDKVDKDKDK